MRLGRSFGNAEHCCNLGVTEPFHIVQDEHRPGASGESGHSIFQIESHPRLGVTCGWLVQQRHIGKVGRNGDAKPATTPLPRTVEHRIHGEAMQPGRECAFTTVAADSLPDPDEDILDQFGGEYRIRAEAKAQRKNPPYVLIVERCKGEVIAALGGQDGRIDRNLESPGWGRVRCSCGEHPIETPAKRNEFTLQEPPCGGPVTRSTP